LIHRTLGWLIAALVISAPAASTGSARQGAIAGSASRPRALLCGRVVMISCTSPRSDVGLILSSPSGSPSWRLVIPSEHRSRFGARIEDLYDQRLVCVTAPAPLGDESVVVTGPDQVVLKDAEPPHPLPADVARTCDPDVRLPRVTRSVHAPYTSSAMVAKVNGSVILRAVVERDGGVGDVRVVRALEPTQDEESSKALAQWQFEPATRGGQRVAMAITVEMAFTRK
jgi:TonB family protein